MWSNVATLHDCSKTHLACWRAVTCVRGRWLPGCPSWAAPLPVGPGASERISWRAPECLVHTGPPDPPEPVAGARLCATTETPWLHLLDCCNNVYTIIPSSHVSLCTVHYMEFKKILYITNHRCILYVHTILKTHTETHMVTNKGLKTCTGLYQTKMNIKLLRKNLVDPGVKQHQSLLLIEQSLLHVELLKDVDVECEVTAECQTLLDKVLHSEFRNLERNQNRPPARVLIHTATWERSDKLGMTKFEKIWLCHWLWDFPYMFYN